MIEKLKNKLGKNFKLAVFTVFTIFWCLFVYSIGGEWLYFIPLFVADAMFWKTFNYKFWKKRKKEKKKKEKSELKSWFDALLFAVIAAHILRTFLIEAYTIPTSSMEKSMLIGDFLFVSKLSYGPRTPMTPFAFPLMHHTIPGTKIKSYSDIIKFPYHRMKGLGDIKRNDCVVFNYPAEKLGRPVDKKENYIKRCVGVPGDTLIIQNGDLFVNGLPHEEPKGMKKQYKYEVSTKQPGLNRSMLQEKYDITEGSYGQNRNEYILTLTDQNRDIINEFSSVVNIKKRLLPKNSYSKRFFPHKEECLSGRCEAWCEKIEWNLDNFGPIIIPTKNSKINLNMQNLALYKDIIERYEGKLVEVKDGLIYINDKEVTSYTFEMDYYWMMGDNRHNSADSRMWGFVPENHIVGKALFIWMSWDKNGKFLKKIRWDRLFRGVK